MAQHRNPTFHRRREDAHRILAAERERALLSMATQLGGALMSVQKTIDAARGDGAFAFPSGPARGAH